jgi:hypothetical protein
MILIEEANRLLYWMTQKTYEKYLILDQKYWSSILNIWFFDSKRAIIWLVRRKKVHTLDND